ncbi:MAG: IS3 family transposase [Treponema sp.]|nr:IS3 family transposase [Treponema sp.]
MALVRLIGRIREAHRGRYGSLRVWRTLLQEFRVGVSRKWVERPMRERGLKARKKKRGWTRRTQDIHRPRRRTC